MTSTGTFALPHRRSRAVVYALLGALGVWILFDNAGSSFARVSVLIVGVAFLAFVEIRTSLLRIVIDGAEIAVHGVFFNRHVRREELRRFDLDLPVSGAFTPGGGQRLVAVLNDGRRVSLTFDITRRPGRHSAHCAELARALNDAIGASASDPIYG